ncbi:MAG: chromosomal replication initiator DnaA [Proteobacteria bacterium SG_bin9]|nr:MAG: chromosomal replication initiator DnaA [Proteobacteria bacterium SG_bin9]
MATGAPPRQLALALPHAERLSRDDFLEGDGNAVALALIDRWPDWPNRTILLAGPEGCGKSHLATIWSDRAGARVISAQALTRELVPSSLSTGALVVEDLDRGALDEPAMFHLMNLARQDEAYVLMTSRTAPAMMPIGLRDLMSRLRAVPVIDVASPDDALLRALIVKLCADRQMLVDESLVSYLMTRIERTFAAARHAVDLLDREGLRLGRPVTRSLAADLLRDR